MTAGTLATPAGVLVYDGPPHTPEWFAARRDGITATDSAKILGLSPYGNATSVWLDKRGAGDEDAASEAAEWGTALEDVIASKWAERHGTTVSPVGILARHDALWLRASLDRLVSVCPDGDGPCALEVKNRSEYKAGDWSDDTPDDVYVQTQHQELVSGYGHIHVAALIGGNRLRSYRVDYDEADAATVRAEAHRVWQAVLAGEPPADHPGALLSQALDVAYPTRTGALVADADQVTALEALVREYDEAHAALKAAVERKEAAGSLLRKFLAANSEVLVEGFPKPVLTCKPQATGGYTVPRGTAQVLRVSKAFTTHVRGAL